MTIDALDSNTLKASLEKNGVGIASAVVECSSTQQYARNSHVERDTVFASISQSEGKGRLGRKFISAEGGCYFTLVTEVGNRSPLSFVPLVSVAVATVMTNYAIDAQIKWPNDILVNGKKICGILSNADDKYVYLGVGINVFNDLSAIADIAVSLYDIGVRNITRAQIIADVLKEFYTLKERSFSDILDIYKKYLNIYGKKIVVNQGAKNLEGIVCGISPEGFLLLENNEGINVIMNGDITFSD